MVDQLVKIYLTEEGWHKNKMSEEEAHNYHKKMLERGNILTYLEDDEIVGYVEVWKINFEQFGKLICQVPFSGLYEDVSSGYIAYVANTWIKESVRNTKVIKILRAKFFNFCHDCAFFVGEAERKKSGLVKVFRQPEFIRKYLIGACHGKRKIE